MNLNRIYNYTISCLKSAVGFEPAVEGPAIGSNPAPRANTAAVVVPQASIVQRSVSIANSNWNQNNCALIDDILFYMVIHNYSLRELPSFAIVCKKFNSIVKRIVENINGGKKYVDIYPELKISLFDRIFSFCENYRLRRIASDSRFVRKMNESAIHFIKGERKQLSLFPVLGHRDGGIKADDIDCIVQRDIKQIVSNMKRRASDAKERIFMDIVGFWLPVSIFFKTITSSFALHLLRSAILSIFPSLVVLGWDSALILNSALNMHAVKIIESVYLCILLGFFIAEKFSQQPLLRDPPLRQIVGDQLLVLPIVLLYIYLFEWPF